MDQLSAIGGSLWLPAITNIVHDQGHEGGRQEYQHQQDKYLFRAEKASLPAIGRYRHRSNS